MGAQEIRSSVEAIDSVVRNYAENIETFRYQVSEKTNDLEGLLYQLANVWEGTLYNQYQEKMRMRLTNIRSQMDRAYNLKGKLDDIASEMAALLEVLRSAGDDQ